MSFTDSWMWRHGIIHWRLSCSNNWRWWLLNWRRWTIIADQMRHVLLLLKRWSLVVIQALNTLVARKLHHRRISNISSTQCLNLRLSSRMVVFFCQWDCHLLPSSSSSRQPCGYQVVTFCTSMTPVCACDWWKGKMVSPPGTFLEAVCQRIAERSSLDTSQACQEWPTSLA